MSDPEGTRKLEAILAADVAGYRGLMGQDEARRSDANSSERRTVCWREPDSNHRSRSCERLFWALPIGDDGGANCRFRRETTMLAWSGSP